MFRAVLVPGLSTPSVLVEFRRILIRLWRYVARHGPAFPAPEPKGWDRVPSILEPIPIWRLMESCRSPHRHKGSSNLGLGVTRWGRFSYRFSGADPQAGQPLVYAAIALWPMIFIT